MNYALLLKYWKWGAAVCVVVILWAFYAMLVHERDAARAELAQAKATIDLLNAAGELQAKHTAIVTQEAAGVTQRATDALVSQLADANARADAVARRLRVLAAAGHGCPVSQPPGPASGADGPTGAPSGPGPSDDTLADYTHACEADSTRLAAWQDWYQAQSKVFNLAVVH